MEAPQWEMSECVNCPAGTNSLEYRQTLIEIIKQFFLSFPERDITIYLVCILNLYFVRVHWCDSSTASSKFRDFFIWFHDVFVTDSFFHIFGSFRLYLAIFEFNVIDAVIKIFVMILENLKMPCRCTVTYDWRVGGRRFHAVLLQSSVVLWDTIWYHCTRKACNQLIGKMTFWKSRREKIATPISSVLACRSTVIFILLR